MKQEYDFEKMKSRKNPYSKKLKKQVPIKVDENTFDYFKGLAKENEISYQALINLYLRDCMSSRRKLKIKWFKAT